jgi:LAO/AO transport system kinase
MTASGDLQANRAAQARRWLWSETAENLMARLREDPAVRQRVVALEEAVSAGQISPRVAAEQLVARFWKDGKDK